MENLEIIDNLKNKTI